MTLPAWVGGQAPAYTGSSTTTTTLTSVPAGSSIVVVSSGESTGQTPTIADSIVGAYTLVGRWTAHDSLGHGGAGGDTGITVYVYRNHPGGSPVITVSSAYIDNGMNAFWIADSLDATTPFGTPVTLAQSASSSSDATTITPTADSYVMSFWAVDYTNVGPVTAFSDDLMHNQSDHYSAEGAVDSVVTAGTPKTVTWTTTNASPGALVVTVPFTKASSGSSGSGSAVLTLLAAGTSAMKATATGLATLALLASGTSLNSTSATGSGTATITLTASGSVAMHASGSGTATLVLLASGTAGVSTIGRYYIPVTIDHTLVAADLTNYTVRVIGTIASLKSVANGGHVAESHGYDIVPCANIDGSGIYPYYLNAWDPTTGFISLVYQKSSLSSSVDPLFYIRYGNASATNGSVPASVFDGSTSLAWDGGDGTTRSGADLTGHGHTASFVEEISGQTINPVLTPIGGGVDLGENTPDPVNFYTQALTVPVTGTEDFLFGPVSGCVVWVARNGVGSDKRGRVLVECVGWTSDGGFYLGEVELRSDSANTSQWLVNIENNPADPGGRGATVESEYPYAHTVPAGTLVYSAQDYNPSAMTVTMHISHYDGSAVFRYTKYVTSITHLRGTDSLPTNLTFGNSITGRSNTDGYLTNVRIHTVSRGDAWFQTEANNLVRPASFFTFGSETDTSNSASGSGTATLTLLASGSVTMHATGTGAATLVLHAAGTGGSGVSGSGAATLVLLASGTAGIPAVVGPAPVFRHLEIFDDWPQNGGTLLSTIREVVSLRRIRSVDGTVTYNGVLALSAPNAIDARSDRAFRAWFEDGTYWEGVWTDDQTAVDDQSVITLTGAGLSAAMAAASKCQSVDGDGVPALRFDAPSLTFAEHWSAYIAPALADSGLSFLDLGTVDPTIRFDLSYDFTDPWSAVQAAATATASELNLRPVGTRYALDLVTKVGEGSSGGELRVARNASVTRIRSRIGQATRAYFEGTDGATMAEAVWLVEAKSGSTVTLADPSGGDGPILADGQMVGLYLEAADRSTRVAITASVGGSTQTVTLSSATAFTVNDTVRFRRDAAGTRIVFLDHPVYAAAPPTGYGIKSATVNRTDLPGVTNLVPNATQLAWSGSSSTAADGWAAVGSPTLTRTTSTGFFETAGKACRVQTAVDGAGYASPVFTIAPTALNPTASAFVRYRLAAGGIRVELVATDGVHTWIVPDGTTQVATDTSTGIFVSVGVAGVDLHALGATAARIRIVQNGDTASDFYVDAAQYTETAGQQAFVDGSGATKGWQAANVYLGINAPLKVRYEGKVIDFARIDPTDYSHLGLVLGAFHPVVDDYLGYVDSARVLTIDENALVEGDTNVTISSRPEDIGSLFAGDPTGRLTPVMANPLALSGALTITDAVTTSGSANLDSASGGWAVGDVGKTIWVLNAGTGQTILKTAIISRTSATRVVLADTAGASGTGLTAVYGTANDVVTLATSVGGARAGAALFNQDGQLASGVTDAQARAVEAFLSKLFTVDPDTLDSVADGVTYLKQIPLLVIAVNQTATDDTTVTVAVAVADPTGGAAPTISNDGGSAVTDNHDGTYTIARPLAGDGPLNVLFSATKTGRQTANALACAPEQSTAGPSIQVTADNGSPNVAIVWSAIGTASYSTNGGTFTTIPTSPFNITRPSIGSQANAYTFKSVLGGVTETDTITVAAINSPGTVTPTLSVHPGTQTATTQPFTVTVADPTGHLATPVLNVRLHNCTATASVLGAMAADTDYHPAATETITVNRPVFTTDPASITFTADLGGSSGNAIVIQRTILNQDVPAPPPAILTTYGAEADPGNGWLHVTWELGYIPSGVYFKLYGFPHDLTNVPSSSSTWQPFTGNNISGASRSANYVIDTEGLGPMLVCAFSNPGAAIHIWHFRLEVYDGSNVIQATADFMTPFWGTPV